MLTFVRMFAALARSRTRGRIGMTEQLATPLAAGLAAALLALPATAQQQHVGDPPEALNMRLVGYNDLQARSAYQPVIQKQGDRWIAYVGHHAGMQPNPLTGKDEPNGTS